MKGVLAAETSTKRSTCYVCGCPRSAHLPLAVRQQAAGPYFPFLETHEPPDGAEPPSTEGLVLACSVCFCYLTEQWNLYERDKVPPVKRIYWLKRVDNGPYTGVEVGVQSEYASQVLGLAPDPPLQPAEGKRAGSSGAARPPPPLPLAAPPVAMEVKRARVAPSQPQPAAVMLPPPRVPPPLPLGLPAIPQVDPQQEALDLSVEGRRGVKRERDEVGDSSTDQGRPDVLDLRMPDKNATTEVCYVCGVHHKKGTLVDIYAKPQSGCPFFPSLTQHPRPSKSHPMEASGRVQSCRDCFRHLQLQWEGYEAHKVPHAERNYSLRKRSPAVAQDTPTTAFVCYKCGRECSSSTLCLVYCRPNSEKEPYFPFIEKLEAPEGASPISPQGMVQMCAPCSKTLSLPYHQQEGKESGRRSSEGTSHPAEGGGSVGGEHSRPQVLPSLSCSLARPVTSVAGERSSPQLPLSLCGTLVHSGANASEDMEAQLDEVACYLCHQNHTRQSMHWLAMSAETTTQDGMYFSFLQYIKYQPQNSVLEDGRVLACTLCHTHLSTQWIEYEREKVKKENRQFSLRSIPISSTSPRLTPGPAVSPVTSQQGSPPHGFCATVDAHMKFEEKVISFAGQPLASLEVAATEEGKEGPALPAITSQRPLSITVNCFVCSFHSKAGQTYALRSKPCGLDPFFPFLSKHQSAHPEARVNDSCVLACLCCFHSLILQWQRYERDQVDHYARLYDTYNYTCYICSLKTYRKRLYLLPVKDYPFLREHNRPVGGLVVEGGHSVVVCKDCYSSLNTQAGEGTGAQVGSSEKGPAAITSHASIPTPPSCYAPLKVSAAIQGGTPQQPPVASGETFSDGSQLRRQERKVSQVDQSPKVINPQAKNLPLKSQQPQEQPQQLPTTTTAPSSSHHSLNHERTVHKKRKSVIRGVGGSAVPVSSSSSSGQLSITPDLLTSHELKAKCS